MQTKFFFGKGLFAYKTRFAVEKKNKKTINFLKLSRIISTTVHKFTNFIKIRTLSKWPTKTLNRQTCNKRLKLVIKHIFAPGYKLFGRNIFYIFHFAVVQFTVFFYTVKFLDKMYFSVIPSLNICSNQAKDVEIILYWWW